MTREHIREVYDTQPFRSFFIRMADGREIEVRHREFMAIGPGGRTVVVFEPNDRMHILDVMLMTELEVKRDSFPQGQAPSGSGL